MATVEIDQAQADAAFKAQALLNRMLTSKTHGLAVKRQIKDEFPEANIPELDIIEQVGAPYRAALAELTAEQAALRKIINDDRLARDTRDAEHSLLSNLSAIRAKYNATDEGMAKVTDTMHTRGLEHDPEAAAALVFASMAKSAPVSSAASLLAPKVDIFGMQGKEVSPDWALLHAQPWDFFSQEIVKVVDEFSQLAA